MNPDSSSPDESNSVVPTGNERILVVDDDPLVLKVSEETLKYLGYDVVSCASGIEALKTFRQDPDSFQLVILDQMMPKMTGDVVAEQLVEVRSDIPIILCSGDAPQLSEERLQQVGIRGYLKKPVPLEEYAHAVRRALDETSAP